MLTRLPLLAALALPACEAPWPEVEPAGPTLRRLTQTQYENAVRDLVGHDIYVPPELEPDFRIHGLTALGSSAVTISPRGVERYEDASYIVAEQAMDAWRRDRLVPCTPADTADADCAAAFFESFGRRAWRRPLTETERDALVQVSMNAAGVLGDFYDGLEFGMAALLQSPDFLLRVELGKPGDDGRRYDAWETASRLSFLFWNSIPDDELLDAAAAGDLDTPDGIDAQAQRLLEHPRAAQGLRAWVTDLLKLDKLDGLAKDPSVFTSITDELGPSAREETLLTYEHVVFTEDADLRSVLTTRTTFLDRTLATLYEVRAPTREGFGRVELPEDGPRVGLLGNASMLALHAHATSTSPTLRGKAIREALLCEKVPAPPGDVDTSIPPADASAPTLRERVQSHLTVPACAACHRTMDLIGLGLENFDGIGKYRTLDNDHPIDASGEVDGAVFQDAAGLAQALHDHEHLVPCMVDQVLRRALGRELGEGEGEAFDALVERFRSHDHRLQPLWLDLVNSPLFLGVGEPSDTVEVTE
jgi:hypothetical protein